MPTFKKHGKPGPGRPKGRLNNATVQAQEFARGIVSSPAYRKRLLERVKGGTLPPAVESMLWHYAWGKPKETVELTGEDGGPLSVVFGGRYRADGSRDDAA